MAATMAHTNTAAAPRSFMSRFLSSLSAFTKSAVLSSEELMISAENTMPITINTATHSIGEIRRINPVKMARIAAVA